MKKRLWLVYLIIILVLLTILFMFILIENKPSQIEINCSSFSLSNCPNSCQICPPCEVCSSLSCNSKEFCNKIGFDINFSNLQRRTFCKEEERNADFCPEYYSPTCGWFDQSIKCLVYPCANDFENPCFACSNKDVLYYTSGKCPKNN